MQTAVSLRSLFMGFIANSIKKSFTSIFFIFLNPTLFLCAKRHTSGAWPFVRLRSWHS